MKKTFLFKLEEIQIYICIYIGQFKNRVPKIGEIRQKNVKKTLLKTGGGKLPQNPPPPSDPYNRAVNFIHFFQIFVRKCAKYHNYTIISYFAENYDISNLRCNIRFYCFLEQKPR